MYVCVHKCVGARRAAPPTLLGASLLQGQQSGGTATAAHCTGVPSTLTQPPRLPLTRLKIENACPKKKCRKKPQEAAKKKPVKGRRRHQKKSSTRPPEAKSRTHRAARSTQALTIAPRCSPAWLPTQQEQELEAMKARLADMEKEAAKLKEMQVGGAAVCGPD